MWNFDSSSNASFSLEALAAVHTQIFILEICHLVGCLLPLRDQTLGDALRRLYDDLKRVGTHGSKVSGMI